MGSSRYSLIDVGIDDRADEAEVLAPLQFGGGVSGVLGCDGGECAEAVGVLLAGDGQLIVGQRCHRGRPVGCERIRTRRGDRQDLAVDPRGVHVCQASFPEIRQSFADEPRTRRVAGQDEAEERPEAGVADTGVEHSAPLSEQFGRRERLLGGDAEITRLPAGMQFGGRGGNRPFSVVATGRRCWIEDDLHQ